MMRTFKAMAIGALVTINMRHLHHRPYLQARRLGQW